MQDDDAGGTSAASIVDGSSSVTINKRNNSEVRQEDATHNTPTLKHIRQVRRYQPADVEVADIDVADDCEETSDEKKNVPVDDVPIMEPYLIALKNQLVKELATKSKEGVAQWLKPHLRRNAGWIRAMFCKEICLKLGMKAPTATEMAY